jgi:hypothetical protein
MGEGGLQKYKLLCRKRRASYYTLHQVVALVQCQHDSSYDRQTAVLGVWNINSRVSKSITQPLAVFRLEPNCKDSVCIGYLTNQLAAWRRVRLVNLIVVQFVKKLPTICGTQKFISMFTRARHLPPSSGSSLSKSF